MTAPDALDDFAAELILANLQGREIGSLNEALAIVRERMSNVSETVALNIARLLLAAPPARAARAPPPPPSEWMLLSRRLGDVPEKYREAEQRALMERLGVRLRDALNLGDESAA